MNDRHPLVPLRFAPAGLALVAALTLVLVLAVACGPAGESTDPTAATPEPSGAEPTTAEVATGSDDEDAAAAEEATGAVDVDAALPAYESVGGISGSLNSMGSDTLNNLMTLWAEGFQQRYPAVRIQVEGKGSSTAPPALMEGTAQLGPMSRAMKPSEIDQFEEEFGYEPTQVRVAIDALAVYVNKDNPLERLTLPEVDAIFSKSRACGADEAIDLWGDVGLEADWATRAISLYGRNSASGTYGYFKQVALCNGDYRDTVKEQPGSASVVNGVAEDLAGIGYSGIGYQTSGVKALALARDEGGEYHETTPEAVLSGEYPLARFLYVYVNKAPNQELDPLVREFLAFILSRDGQQVVVKDGYLPLSEALAAAERAELE